MNNLLQIEKCFTTVIYDTLLERLEQTIKTFYLQPNYARKTMLDFKSGLLFFLWSEQIYLIIITVLFLCWMVDYIGGCHHLIVFCCKTVKLLLNLIWKQVKEIILIHSTLLLIHNNLFTALIYFVSSGWLIQWPADVSVWF